MGLILCENKKAVSPLFINDLGIRVFTLEELCYVIYNFPFTAIGGLVNDRLIKFLRHELGMNINSLERYVMEWAGEDEVLFAILEYSDYYSQNEIDEYKIKLDAVRKLERYEFYRQKGDVLFRLGHYGKALSCYQSGLRDSADRKPDEIYFFRIYRSIGMTYANLFQPDDAFDAFKKALEYGRDEEIIKKIYFLSHFQDIIEKKETYLKYVSDADVTEWEKEYMALTGSADDTCGISETEALLHMDSVKRRISMNNIINSWKRKYRNML